MACIHFPKVFHVTLGVVVLSMAACGGGPVPNKTVRAPKPEMPTSEALITAAQTPPSVPSAVSSSVPPASPFKPALGVNTTPLFTQPVKKSSDRFDRLETAVQEIRNDVNTIAEAVDKNHRTVEPQIQEIPITHIPKIKAIEPKTVETQSAQPALAPQSSHIIRIADHPGKTRIVFESSSAFTAVPSLDNEENILLVRVSKGTANPAATHRSRLISSVQTKKDQQGFTAILPLAKPSNILTQTHLPPSKSNPNHRFFIDLKS